MIRPLRLGVPAWTLVPAAMGGSETYARELLRSLSERSDVEVTTLVGRDAAGVLPSSHEVVAARVGGGASVTTRGVNLVRAALPGRTTRAVLQAQDVVHYPFSVPVPRGAGVPWVVTLHDVQHLDLPQMFTRAEREYRRLAYDLPARRAGAVVTVSEFCRSRIVDRLGIPAHRVRVAPLGVDTSRFVPHTGGRERFVLCPATAWPHKNHRRLVAAMALVRETSPDLRLVLTGGRLESLGELPPWVEVRGHVPIVELQRLYRSAACLALPSLYEGFGLPVLEAMASGCPVAASDRGALAETAGGAAVLFDPEDARAVADGILRALGRASTLSAAGPRRAATFTWSRCAERHMDVYDEMVGSARV
jgi:glycosyltransferase involved in cell wall biosynthesis